MFNKFFNLARKDTAFFPYTQARVQKNAKFLRIGSNLRHSQGVMDYLFVEIVSF